MEFASDTQTASFHSPLEDFERVAVDVEVREDPLTGRRARLADGSFLTPEDEPDLEAVVGDDEGCFFCPGTVTEATPTYPDWVEVDRGERGEAVSFPNLNPYGAHSNVVVLTEDHYRPLDELGTGTLADGLGLALEYVAACIDHDAAASVASVNMNFLRPAGSSIIHPHCQTLVDDRGTTEQARRLEAARDYEADTGSPYWVELVDAERGGERWIGSTGGVDWLAAFAPKHHRHVQGIVREPGLPAPDGAVVDGLAAGLDAVLASYAAAGLNSFNFALHLVEAEDAWRPVLDVIARSVFDAYYWSDSPYFAVLHDEGVVDTPPEAYAAEVRDRL